MEIDETTEEQVPYIPHYEMTKYTFKAEMDKFPEREQQEVVGEFGQIHIRKTFMKNYAHELTPMEKGKSIDSIMMFKRNYIPAKG